MHTRKKIPDLFSPRQGLLNPAKQGPSPRPAAESGCAKTSWSPLVIAIHQRYRPSPAVPLWWVPGLWARFVAALADPVYAEQFNAARRTQECSLKFATTVFRELLEVATWSSGRNIRISNTRLAARTGRSPRHVRRATALLEQFGWIVAHYRGTGGGQNGEYGPNIARLRYASNPLLEAARRQFTAATSTNSGPCENVHLSVCGPLGALSGLLGGTSSKRFSSAASKDGGAEPRAGPDPPPKPALSAYITDPPRSPRHRRGWTLPSGGPSGHQPRRTSPARRATAERIAHIATGPLKPSLGVTARQVAIAWAAQHGTDVTWGTTTNDDAARMRGVPEQTSGARPTEASAALGRETPHQQHQRNTAKAQIAALLKRLR